MSMIPAAAEFHLSIRVTDLDASTALHTAFRGVEPSQPEPAATVAPFPRQTTRIPAFGRLR